MENRLRAVRKSYGLGLVKLASLVETTDQQLSRLERDQRNLTKEWVERIAEGYRKGGYPVHEADLLGLTRPIQADRESAVIVLSPVGVDGWFSPMETDNTVRAALALRAPIDFGRIRVGDIVLGDPEEPYGPGDVIYIETVDNRAALAVFKGQTGMGMTIERPNGRRTVPETLKHGIIRKIVRILWGSV